MTIDQQFVEYIIKSIVGDPEQVHIERTVDEKGVLLTLTVAADDLGRVIGKRGTTAQSIRTLLRALGTKNDARYNLKIVDLNRPEEAAAPAPEASEVSAEAAPAAEEPAAEEVAAQELAAENVDVPAQEAVPEAPEPAEVETAAAPIVEETTPEVAQDDHSDVVSKTRAELEELDDLDI